MTDIDVITLNKPEQNDPLQEVIREGARKMLATAIEVEVAAFIEQHSALQTGGGKAAVVAATQRAMARADITIIIRYMDTCSFPTCLNDVTHPCTNASFVDGMCRYRDGYSNRVLAPEGEILFFAQPSYMDVVNAENAGAIFRKEKYPKEKTPGCRLLPGLRRFYRGLPKGTPVPLAMRGFPAAPLTGYSR